LRQPLPTATTAFFFWERRSTTLPQEQIQEAVEHQQPKYEFPSSQALRRDISNIDEFQPIRGIWFNDDSTALQSKANHAESVDPSSSNESDESATIFPRHWQPITITTAYS
jgi:hypothetical protein